MKRFPTRLLVVLVCLAGAPLARADGADLRPLLQWVAQEGETYQPTTHRRYVVPAPLAKALGIGIDDVLIRQKAVVTPDDDVNIIQVTENTRRDILVSRREHLGGRWLFWRVAPDDRILATAMLEPDGSVSVAAETFESRYRVAMQAIRASAAAAGRRRGE